MSFPLFSIVLNVCVHKRKGKQKALYQIEKLKKITLKNLICVFFFDNPGYLDQFTRTMTNSLTHWTACKPSRQVKHRKVTSMHKKNQTQVH
jgi:hypothetical protein